MPVTKQAIKKVRQDSRKTVYNARTKRTYKKSVKDYLKNPTDAGLKSAFSSLDRAAKINVIHTNKASRLKSRLTKKLGSKSKKPSVSSKKTSNKK